MTDSIISKEESMPGINDFQWSYTEEPHCSRREAILKEHKDIKKLFGHDPRQKYYAFGTVLLQVTMAFLCGKPACPWWLFVAVSWVIGGTCIHSLTLAIHEMSHNLFFKKTISNVLFSFFCNLPFVIPFASNFKKYHLEHHKKQGYDGVDSDIPTVWEARTFTTPFRKFFWVLFQSFFYASRPLIINPKPFNRLDFVNIIIQVIFTFVIAKFAGPAAIVYLLLSVFLGLGMHPCAGHFIAEHYTGIWTGQLHQSGWTPIKKGGDNLQIDETFTYRGPLNMLSYNVGFHCAHHDFPYVAGSRLPEVEKMAPEFYDHVPECKSWPGTIWRYIFSEGTPFDRVKRKGPFGKDSKPNKKSN